MVMENLEYDLNKIKKMLSDIRENFSLDPAQDFIVWLSSFSRYCPLEKSDEWEEAIARIIGQVMIYKFKYKDDIYVKEAIADNDYSIISRLCNFINAGEIMKVYDESKSWELVSDVLKNQSHSFESLMGLTDVLLNYSKIGVSFIERFNYSNIHLFEDEYVKAKNDLDRQLILK